MDLPKNLFKQRLRARHQQIGLWGTIPDPGVFEALAGTGFDWLVLDTEHSPIDPASTLHLLQAAAPYPTQIMVRPSVNDTALIKRHLDMGAQTLLIPYVQTGDEAQAAIDAMHYGPRGVRGVAGGVRASRYGRIADYMATASEEMCLILQVESAQAVERLEEIAGREGVDGIFIGPADLAASLGYPGQMMHPVVTKTILDTITKLTAMGVPAGILTMNAGFARDCMAAGTVFTAVGTDMGLMLNGADQLLRDFSA